MGLSVQLNNIQRESQLEEMYKYYLLEENNKVVTKIQLQFEAAISVMACETIFNISVFLWN